MLRLVSPRLPGPHPRVLAALSLVFLLVACSSDEPAEPTDTESTAPDTRPGSTPPPSDVSGTSSGDIGTDPSTDASFPPTMPSPGETVEIDLGPWIDPPGEGRVIAAQVEREEQLLEGEGREARIGDYFLENDHARYIIEFGDRAIGPCAWDGNPIDVAPLGPDGTQAAQTIIGQICLLLNVGQTFRPERVEVIEDGSDGRAILAVTGRTAWLDFLNLRSMVDSVVPGFLALVPIDPDFQLPLTITVYYALSPDSRSLRVVTAFRSHHDRRIHFVATHLVLSGSTGSFFTPLGSTGGFGYRSLGADNLDSDPISFLSYLTAHGHYTFVPDPHERLARRLPVGGGMIAVSGAATVTHGADDLVGVLLANPRRLDTTAGYIGLDPGETAAVGYRLHTGTGSLQTTVDQVYADLGVDTAPVHGTVVDHEGAAAPNAIVTAVEQVGEGRERTLNQARTDDEGRFSMALPEGDYTLRARADGSLALREDLRVDAGAPIDVGTLALPESATVQVHIRSAAGDPVPGRVTVACEGGCGLRRPDSLEVEGAFQPPLGWERIVFVGVEGQTRFELAPGRYRVHVTRGMTWSTWPTDTVQSGGHLIDVDAGDELTLDAEIDRVVDTTGALGADFHIHAMASPDSSVADRTRVLDFLAGGLDVMVSSDHDAVTDFAPTIAALGAGDQITSLIGNEITTPNIGHINAFPLERDEDARRGGPVDWSNEGGDHLTLAQLAARIFDVDYERVLQVNHPAGTGTFGVMKADVLTGQSFANREELRMPPGDADPETGDTGLWTDDFTAVEIMNGFGTGNFWSGTRWWMTMIARGFSPAGTAVSDTHGIYGSLGASPRSFVFVDPGTDTPASMQTDRFVRSINSGRLIGTNGPFVTVEVSNTAGDVARIGDTLDVQDGPATALVRIQTPEWMQVDTLDLYMNVEDDLIGDPGQALTHPLEPTRRIPLDWNPQEHLVTIATGENEHRRWEQTVTVELDTDTDAWVIFMVRGLQTPNMRPVLSSGAQPLAFTNPLFLDADGGGYDNPPLAGLAAQRRTISAPLRFRHVSGRPVSDTLTPEDVGALFDALRCGVEDHVDGHGHHHHGHGHGHHHHGHDHGHGHHHHHGHGHHHHGPRR
ncbi:MAG: hypothetical protein EA398_01850 [Deltaproteobacteria bacterium]|nr:MAG: hypothetical protein EA398_01850 [Deltaproteobacteria bacterium]